MKLILRYQNKETYDECKATDENAIAVIQLLGTEKDLEYKMIDGYWSNRIAQVAHNMKVLGVDIDTGCEDTYFSYADVEKAESEYNRIKEILRTARKMK